MIGPTGPVRVMVATRPVDFRKGAEGLAALVRETMGADPFSGAIYVFRARRADRIKLVYFDGTGVCLLACGFREAFPETAHCPVTVQALGTNTIGYTSPFTDRPRAYFATPAASASFMRVCQPGPVAR